MTGEAKVCDECGSLVADAAKHDGWHYEMRSDMGALWLALRDLEDR